MYKILKHGKPILGLTPESLEEELNKLAPEGYELVTITGMGTVQLSIWKKKE